MWSEAQAQSPEGLALNMAGMGHRARNEMDTGVTGTAESNFRVPSRRGSAWFDRFGASKFGTRRGKRGRWHLGRPRFGTWPAFFGHALEGPHWRCPHKVRVRNRGMVHVCVMKPM